MVTLGSFLNYPQFSKKWVVLSHLWKILDASSSAALRPTKKRRVPADLQLFRPAARWGSAVAKRVSERVTTWGGSQCREQQNKQKTLVLASQMLALLSGMTLRWRRGLEMCSVGFWRLHIWQLPPPRCGLGQSRWPLVVPVLSVCLSYQPMLRCLLTLTSIVLIQSFHSTTGTALGTFFLLSLLWKGFKVTVVVVATPFSS